MAEKRRIKARSVSNVAASKTALIDLPVGPRYHYLNISHGHAGTDTIAGATANITEIRVIVNDRVQRVFSGVQLRDLNILNGATFDCQGKPSLAPGVSFPIFFAEPWRKDSRSQDALAWVSSGFKSFRIEVDIGAASTPTLTASAVVDDFQPSVEPLFVTMRRQQVASAGTSFDITTIDKKGLLQQVTIYPDSTNAVGFSVITARVDGRIIHELTAADNFALLMNNEMTPRLAAYTNDAAVAASARGANATPTSTGKIYDVVFDHDDLLNSSLNLQGAKELTLTLEAASAMAGSVTFIIQRYGPLE